MPHSPVVRLAKLQPSSLSQSPLDVIAIPRRVYHGVFGPATELGGLPAVRKSKLQLAKEKQMRRMFRGVQRVLVVVANRGGGVWQPSRRRQWSGPSARRGGADWDPEAALLETTPRSKTAGSSGQVRGAMGCPELNGRRSDGHTELRPADAGSGPALNKGLLDVTHWLVWNIGDGDGHGRAHASPECGRTRQVSIRSKGLIWARRPQAITSLHIRVVRSDTRSASAAGDAAAGRRYRCVLKAMHGTSQQSISSAVHSRPDIATQRRGGIVRQWCCHAEGDDHRLDVVGDANRAELIRRAVVALGARAYHRS